MDIRAAIARSLSFSALLGAFFAIYGAMLIFAVPYLADLTGIGDGIIAAIAALLSVVLARYVQDGMRRLTDKFLFQGRADYRAALVKTSRALSGTIQIEDVADTTLHTMRDIVRTKKTIIFLRQPKGTGFHPQDSYGVKNFHVTIPKDHAIIKHLQHSRAPIVKDELAIEREQEKSAHHAAEIEKIEHAFTWLDVSVILPLFVNKELTGLIALGEKKAGTPYLNDDIEFLSALAPQAATALENARLYAESQEFGKKLQVEVKRATHELEQANIQLRDLDKAKSEFLSVASHQLYTPLTALRGYLSMLKEEEYGQIKTQQKPIINILEKSATRLISLIKNLLDISRIESGRLQLNLASLDLSLMAKQLVQDLSPNALKKKIKIKFHEPTTPAPHVVADEERIRQVLLNMIDNAIKYTDKGRVDVKVISDSNNSIIFSVTDSGRGMTQDEISKIFTKFTRVGGASRYRTEGTGLGLYVAKQILREHHGDVEVTSPGLGRGSTFAVRLPVEGSPTALKVGDTVEVEIKAAEATGKK
jgi:signal transduction histidine kinase